MSGILVSILQAHKNPILQLRKVRQRVKEHALEPPAIKWQI